MMRCLLTAKTEVIKLNKLAQWGYLGLVYVFLYFPIAVLIAYSFNDSSYSSCWQGFTLKWYFQLAAHPHLWTSALHSLILGVTTATLATGIGSIAAIWLYRYSFYGKSLFQWLLLIWVISPEIVIAISLLLLFSIVQIPLGFGTLLLSQITFCIPFVTLMVHSLLRGFDQNLLEAARDLGAEETVLFKRILIPLLRPAILASWLLSFALSFDDVIISLFVSGPHFQILPLEIYSWVKLGLKPVLNALCSLLFGVTLLLALSLQLLQRKEG